MPGVKQRGSCRQRPAGHFGFGPSGPHKRLGWRVGLSAPRPGGFPVPTGPFWTLLTTAAQGPFFHGYASVPVPGRCCAASRGLPSAHLSRETPSLREGRGSGEGWAVLTLAEKAG